MRVSNACGNVTAIASVSVQTGCTAVSIIGQPVSTTVNSGGTATLTVTAGGSSPFSYQWYQATSTLDTSHPVGPNSPTFTTPALTQATSYFVKVTNGCGIVNSNVATVSIAGQCTPPSFAIQPSSATIAAGSQTYLIAFATGAASYQWYKGNAGDTSTPVAGIGPSAPRRSSSTDSPEIASSAPSAMRKIAAPGLCHRPTDSVCQAFVTQMLKHWNENYQLDLEEDALTDSVLIKEL